MFLIELFTPLGVTPEDGAFFASRLLILATSCVQRRLAEDENIRWWDFIAAAGRSKIYQAYLGQGLTRSLVAMRAEESSTRTVGYILLQLFYGLISPDRLFDRLLCGPTNDVWIAPWTEYLRKLGVEFHTGSKAAAIGCSGEVTAVVDRNGNRTTYAFQSNGTGGTYTISDSAGRTETISLTEDPPNNPRDETTYPGSVGSIHVNYAQLQSVLSSGETLKTPSCLFPERRKPVPAARRTPMMEAGSG